MIIKDERLMDEFREGGWCEWCRKFCLHREPHHLYCRGMGGGGRLDIRINLIALGSSFLFVCTCHQDVHAGRITRDDLLAVVAARELTTQDAIRAEIRDLRNKRR